MFRSFRGWQLWRSAAVSGLLLFGLVGCGPALYPTRGKVTYSDGKPVPAGMVVFESKDREKPVTARGEIHSDGTFELSTYKPGDGALPGKYRVLVSPKFDPNAIDRRTGPPPFDPRSLELEVKTDGPNEFPIQVSPTKR